MNSYTTVEKSLAIILEELNELKKHIEEYSTGAFPAYFMQLNSVLKIQDILEMKLSDAYYCEDGYIQVRSKFVYNDIYVEINEEGRKELAWYVMQRISVCNTKSGKLEDWLCVNKQGNQLQMQAYRKMLDRSSGELGLSRVYTAGYLHCLYGYLSIAHGKKTIKEVAKEYNVGKQYLLTRIFKGIEIQYAQKIIEKVANINDTEGNEKNVLETESREPDGII